jgi:hypothetical protein
VIYVTDAGQDDHFDMIFVTTRNARLVQRRHTFLVSGFQW